MIIIIIHLETFLSRESYYIVSFRNTWIIKAYFQYKTGRCTVINSVTLPSVNVKNGKT